MVQLLQPWPRWPVCPAPEPPPCVRLGLWPPQRPGPERPFAPLHWLLPLAGGRVWGRRSWEWGWLSCCRPPAPFWAALRLGGAGAVMGAGDLWPRVRDRGGAPGQGQGQGLREGRVWRGGRPGMRVWEGFRGALRLSPRTPGAPCEGEAGRSGHLPLPGALTLAGCQLPQLLALAGRGHPLQLAPCPGLGLSCVLLLAGPSP